MAKLALRGGKRLFGKGDFKSTWPIVTKADVNAAAKVAASGNWWRYVPHSHVEKFEQEYAAYHDARYCLAVNNGTVAIDAALRALGVEPGDEVIVTGMTFIASASAVVLARAVPVFADIDPETYQLSAASVEAQITRRTRGIVAVHYAGYPCNMTALRKIARKHGLFLLEDSSHAQGTEWRGRKVGAIGDAGTFSFQQSKSLTSGEGGAIVTDKQPAYEKAYAYHHIGRTLWAKKYEHTIVGQNYRLTELQGCLLRTQLRKLQRQTEQKMKNVAAFFEQIADIPGLVPLRPDKRITQRGYYFVVLRYLQDRMKGVHRDRFLEALRAEGVPIGTGYGVPVYAIPVFGENSFGEKGCPVTCRHYGGAVDYAKVHLPAVEHACRHEQMTIPHQYFVYRSNVRKFAAAMHKVYADLDELTEPAAG